MSKLKIALAIYVLFTISCLNIKKGNLDIASIEILYIKGSVETRSSILCDSLTKAKSFFRIKDTILLSEHLNFEIVKQVRLLKELNTKENFSNCDIRMQCRINFTNGDTVKLCVGRLNCIIKDGLMMKQNDTLVYLIRNHSGYYNYFPKEELGYFQELKFFELPKDYKDLTIRNNNLNGPPLPPDAPRFKDEFVSTTIHSH